MERVDKILGALTGNGMFTPKGEAAQSETAKPTPLAAATEKPASARQPFKRKPIYRASSKPTAVEGILSKVLARHGLDVDIARYSFVKHWKEIAGERFASVTKPEGMHGKVLIVRVPNSVWAQEITFAKQDILARLAPFLVDGEEIEDLILRVR